MFAVSNSIQFRFLYKPIKADLSILIKKSSLVLHSNYQLRDRVKLYQSTQKSVNVFLLQEPLISEAVDPPKNKPFNRNVSASKTTAPRSSSPAASPSAEASGETLILQETTAAAEALDAPADRQSLQQSTAEQEPPGLDLLGVTGGPERHLEALEALRDISKLREKFSKLQARVVELEEGKLEQSQLTHVTELITNKGSTLFCKSYIHTRRLNQHGPDLY